MIKTIIHGFISVYKKYSTLQKLACWILGGHLVIVLFGNIIANDKPIFCVCDGQWYLPALYSANNYSSMDFQKNTCSFRLMPLISWSSGSIDANSSGYAPPLSRSGRHRHWLGTDALGRDVLAGLIYGTRYAWTVGFLSTLFALIPGILIGMMIGYWKNEKLKWSWGQSIFFILWSGLFLYESKVLYWISPTGFYFISIATFLLIWYRIGSIAWNYLGTWGKKIHIPVDSLIMRAIDIFDSFPKLLLLMALMITLNRPSIFTLSLLIALIQWTLFAQIARSETFKESVANYVLAAENINLPWYKILFRHIWPNIKSALWVTAVFTFSASVLLEASLSFIGLGLRLERVTWGSLLNESRQYFPGWWLSLFPGLAIFSLLFALNWLFIIKNRNAKSLSTSNA
ncbi:MAG: ABC transporter permease [Saprospiraceae bacterium]